MQSEKIKCLVEEYRALGVDKQIDYHKFYLYSIITHSTAIEGSTISEVENQLIFDEGLSCNKNINEIMMNLDLKKAYEKAFKMAEMPYSFTINFLKELSATIMKNTGSVYKTINGNFDASKGDIRLLNVSSGRGGKSYLSFEKIKKALNEFCDWVNTEREKLKNKDNFDVAEAYKLSFLAHYRLVFIHPFVDGNGRLSRLIMNMIQFEFNLIPSIVKMEERADYIKSLSSSQDKDSPYEFIDFMMNSHIKNLEKIIAEYRISKKQ